MPVQGVFAQVAPTQLPVETYDQLLTAVRATRAETRERIETAVAQEKVREAWTIGKLIDEHVLHHKERADYGKYTIERLAKDLEISRTELYFMLRFARDYPTVWPAKQLSWSHYQALMRVKDPELRQELAEKAEKEKWTRDELRQAVRKINKPEAEAPVILNPDSKPGKLGMYLIVRSERGNDPDELVLDLGFSTYRRFRNSKAFKEGDIIKRGRSGYEKIENADEDSLHTYRILTHKVVDGDTFWALIDLGFGITMNQKLRLRGLNAPEIESADGLEAKEYLEEALASGEILIRTVKSDKYDRYLADVFVNDRYINQDLVAQDLATIIDAS